MYRVLQRDLERASVVTQPIKFLFWTHTDWDEDPATPLPTCLPVNYPGRPWKRAKVLWLL